MRPASAALGLALLLVAVAFVAPSRPAQAADLTGEYGGDFGMALLAAPSWSPLSTDPADARVHNLVWDTLARPDPVTGEPKPWAAVSWIPNPTARTITVTPRADLIWSDGTAIGLADLRTTFEQYGFTVSFTGSDLVFNFASVAPGRFYTEALYGWIAWNSAGQTRYSGMFAPSPTNSSVLQANLHYWAGRPYLDSIRLVVTTLGDAACQLLKARIDFLGFPLRPNDLSDQWACTQYGGWTDPLGNPVNKSLVNANATLTEDFLSSVDHPGPTFLYYWINVPAGGVLGDVNFRTALYNFVNKQLAKSVEPSSDITNSLINRHNAFWYLKSQEVAVDAGFTAIDGRQDTNPLPGIQALDRGLYLDVDGDGWRETPSGADFSLRVGGLDFLVGPDPRKSTIASGFVNVLQRQGVNATFVGFPSWAALRAAETAGTIDVALEVADTATANPRFLETFQPILDANDARTIQHMNLGRNSFTLSERVLHFNHVTYYNSLCACVLPVLHYETLETYNRNTTEGWVDSFGGINNVWSFSNLKKPQLGPIAAEITTFSRSVASDGTTTIQVSVVDEDSLGVVDATVELTASASGGTFTPATGVTDGNGRFSATWRAPVVVRDTDITVQATVTKSQHRGDVASTEITVHAPFLPLEVTVTPAQSTLGPGNSTAVVVTVVSRGQPVAGANVSLTVSLPGGALTSYSGVTASNGEFPTSFTASPKVRSIYRIDAVASARGYEDGTGTGSVFVEPDFGTYTQIDVTQNVPGFETVVVLAALGAAVAILRWRNRREG